MEDGDVLVRQDRAYHLGPQAAGDIDERALGYHLPDPSMVVRDFSGVEAPRTADVADLAAHHRLDRLGDPLAHPFDRLDLDSETDLTRAIPGSHPAGAPSVRPNPLSCVFVAPCLPVRARPQTGLTRQTGGRNPRPRVIYRRRQRIVGDGGTRREGRFVNQVSRLGDSTLSRLIVTKQAAGCLRCSLGNHTCGGGSILVEKHRIRSMDRGQSILWALVCLRCGPRRWAIEIRPLEP